MKEKHLGRYAVISIIGVIALYIMPFITAQKYLTMSIDNPFISIFQNMGFIISFQNTVLFMVIFVPIVVLLGFVLAFATEYLNLGFGVQAVIVMPVIVPVATVAGFFREIVYNFISKYVSGIYVVGIIFIWASVGFTYIIFLISLKKRDKTIEEAAYLDGAGVFRTLFKIVVPLHIDAVILASVISIYNSLKVFKLTYAIFGEFPSYNMFMMQNFLHIKLKELSLDDLMVSADIFLIFILVVLGLILALGKYSKNKIK